MNRICRIAVLAILILVAGAPSLRAAGLCEQKAAGVRHKLTEAETAGRRHQAAGLREALDNILTFCTDESEQASIRMDLAERRREVEEREQDLAEARRKGDRKKIAKRERKLQEAKMELEQAVTRHEALRDLP